MVGHVDFKFVLNSSITNIPQIQVTLLKNKAPGLGKVNGKKITEQFAFSNIYIFLMALLNHQLEHVKVMTNEMKYNR